MIEKWLRAQVDWHCMRNLATANADWLLWWLSFSSGPNLNFVDGTQNLSFEATNQGGM